MELGKTFDPRSAEERWFDKWVELGYFQADPARPGPVFSIVIPPPNVTGQLHLGHALNVALHDVIVRTRRMQGYNTLWLPGTDHAGIATQNVVERELAKEGLSRHQLGREAFVKRVWEWRETYGSRILNQLRRLGASCDWSRERFTLDPGLSRAVTEAFVRLYDAGLIYRARRMVNWCPRCETALSDLEVEHRQTQAKLYYVRYPFADGSGSVVVATTRPETMLGDTAVAVNTDDDRYRRYIRKKVVRLPLVGREIPFVGHEGVDRNFGTGALKVTPAHDPFDLILAQTEKLDLMTVIGPDGRMTSEAGAYAGLTREECRKRVLSDLEREGLLEKSEAYVHNVAVCSRCDTVLEPMLSWQWFLRVNTAALRDGKRLAGEAIAAVESGATRFHPEFWKDTYFGWMRSIHDWCISRQLWWGHRIPAWWCDNHECPRPIDDPIVQAEPPEKCPTCGGARLRQDDDVLDTWFSSGLWPFSTLGWPDQTADLRTYYPTSLLITGFDIIFFWVARMMMLGLRFMNDVPFRDVYITPLVRDQYGKKMTKSRGNVVDPLDIIGRYGTDAVRFTLAQLAVQGRDVILSDERLAASRAFANKIWNAARFAMMNLDGAPQPVPSVDTGRLSLADRWILDRLDAAVREVSAAIDGYEFNIAALRLYQFIWNEFCDWYIELAKEPLKAGGDAQAAARWTLVRVLDSMLRLLHPFMPFISEEIWQVLRPYIDAANLAPHLAIATFPMVGGRSWLSQNESIAMKHCIEATEAVNSLRALVGVRPGANVRVWIRPVFLPTGTVMASARGTDEEFHREFGLWKPYIVVRAKSDPKPLNLRDPFPQGGVSSFLGWSEIAIEPPVDFDIEKTRAAIRRKFDEVEGYRKQHEKRLLDPIFQEKARKETLWETQDRLNDLISESSLLKRQLESLGVQVES